MASSKTKRLEYLGPAQKYWMRLDDHCIWVIWVSIVRHGSTTCSTRFGWDLFVSFSIELIQEEAQRILPIWMRIPVYPIYVSVFQWFSNTVSHQSNQIYNCRDMNHSSGCSRLQWFTTLWQFNIAMENQKSLFSIGRSIFMAWNSWPVWKSRYGHWRFDHEVPQSNSLVLLRM
jgi:hypothetical protein